MEFNDRRAKTKFHVLTPGDPSAIHSSHGDFTGAASVVHQNKSTMPGAYVADSATTARNVPGFDPDFHSTCEYCTAPATHIGRDTGEAICKEHGKDMYDDPKHSLAKLTPRTVKMYGRG